MPCRMKKSRESFMNWRIIYRQLRPYLAEGNGDPNAAGVLRNEEHDSEEAIVRGRLDQHRCNNLCTVLLIPFQARCRVSSYVGIAEDR